MSGERFWSIIAVTSKPDEPQVRAERLAEVLQRESAADYELFLAQFHHTMHEIKSNELLINAALLSLEGCMSDDTFDYFAFWLIGAEKDHYHTAITRPDSILETMEIYGEPNFDELGEAVYRRAVEEKIDISNEFLRPKWSSKIWPDDKQRAVMPLLYEYSLC